MSRISECVTCHRERPIHAHDQCATCYRRPYQPPTGNPGALGVAKSRQVVTRRMEDLAELLAQREDIRMIARRLGVSVRTVQRYKARLRERAA